jgi:hypothetical protein
MSNETLTCIAIAINTLALIFVITQTLITKRALNAARQSIDNARLTRQLELLPKYTWVIQVQVNLEHWQKDLSEKKERLQRAINNGNDEILKELSGGRIKASKDLSLNRFLYEKMPSWLREIWMAGAQYYYNAVASMQFLWRNEKERTYSYALAKDLQGACDESEKAIGILINYIQDLIPTVILNAPASRTDEDFLSD